MNNEIKEILNWLNQIIKENKESDVSLNGCVVPFETLYKLQDYITNLEQKIKHYEETTTFGDYVKEVNLLVDYKSRIEKAVEYMNQSINESQLIFGWNDIQRYHDKEMNDLLNILNGKE